ncbi:hypothetical protein VNI00_008778 [Paramarasmius palmivorus]|uniref:Nephrocystin 3-like N-terminal domain-containing protein n=1 Tax=Paramarasmius palmivorus TaxID=297713 RepID=A0AAW0CWS4_9AGAR
MHVLQEVIWRGAEIPGDMVSKHYLPNHGRRKEKWDEGGLGYCATKRTASDSMKIALIQDVWTVRDDILRTLAARAVVNATYDSEERFPPPNCHPNTRVNTLSTLGLWVDDPKSTIRVFWLHGSAGVGKSAIAQKLAEDHPSRLVAAFFFSRNDTTRDKLDQFVATIAYQCCTSDRLKDVVGPLIIDAIRSNPNIFRTSSENQFRKLLLVPFSKLNTDSPLTLPDLIVVDGLDECVDPSSQARLLNFVDDAVTFPTPFPFKFLLCSRPEPQLRNAFINARFAPCLECITISDTTIRFLGYLSESDIDIQRYLSEKFTSLREKYRAVLRDDKESWPGEDTINELVWRASGQFIFAVTVIKYVDTMDDLPQDRLQTILSTQTGEITNTPYPALDLLYRQILSACRRWDRVSLILRLLITPHPNVTCVDSTGIRWNSPSVISQLFEWKAGEVEASLSRLHAVLHIPEDGVSEIRILHASFTEFLLDKVRSGEYRVSKFPEEEYCSLVTVLLLRMMSSFTSSYPLYRPPNLSPAVAFTIWKDVTSSMDTLTLFAINNWAYYCVQAGSPNTRLLAELGKFDPYCVVAMLLSKFGEGWFLSHLPEWKACLSWAQSFEKSETRIFIERLKSFSSGLYLGFSRETMRYDATWITFKMECSLRAEYNVNRLTDLVTKYYRKWWSESSGSLWTPGMFPLVLPTTINPVDVVPEDWVVVRLVNGNDEKLQRVHDVYRSLGSGGRRLFNDDVLYGTSGSVSRNLVKEKDLVAFKTLLYHRRDIFSVLGSHVISKGSGPEHFLRILRTDTDETELQELPTKDDSDDEGKGNLSEPEVDYQASEEEKNHSHGSRNLQVSQPSMVPVERIHSQVRFFGDREGEEGERDDDISDWYNVEPAALEEVLLFVNTEPPSTIRPQDGYTTAIFRPIRNLFA